MRADSVAVLREFDGLIADAGVVDADMAALVTEAQRPVSEDVAAQSAEIARLSRLIGE
jgi:phage-related baseplate assembly protein